jgi:hypothetical protein
MFTRLLLVLLLVATFTVPGAAQGQGGAGEQGVGAVPDSESNSGGGSGNGGSGGQGKGNANGLSSDSTAERGAPGGGKTNPNAANMPAGNTPSDKAVSLSPDEALAMVRTKRALPLTDLTEIVHQRSGAEMVDAELLRIDQMLVYGIKVIDPAGRLSVQYYYARSGRYIGSE